MSKKEWINALDGYPKARIVYPETSTYATLAFPDESTDGDPMWCAVSLKYDGAIGQGFTSDEAIEMCHDVIDSFREHFGLL